MPIQIETNPRVIFNGETALHSFQRMLIAGGIAKLSAVVPVALTLLSGDFSFLLGEAGFALTLGETYRQAKLLDSRTDNGPTQKRDQPVKTLVASTCG